MAFKYSLQEDIITKEDKELVIDLLRSGDILTMNSNVKQFEKKFAEYLHVPYAVMVNSGSSANLLAFSCATNIDSDCRLNLGDEVLVPSVCWSTSIWPIIQTGLVPVFVDIDPSNLQIDLADMVSKITPKTRAILLVHVIGIGPDMNEVLDICKQHNLTIIEDSCECLGTTFNDRQLGTFGKFGTYSFYYSHHITTIEGGMVVCHTLRDYNLLNCLRAHGWSRDQSNKNELETSNSDIDPRFLFINMGYNFRPTEINGVLGLAQLAKLPQCNAFRKANYNKIRDIMIKHPNNGDKLTTIHIIDTRYDVAWFAFPVYINDKYANKLREFTTFLSNANIQNRPIISGNFCRQPVIKKLGINVDFSDLKGAEKVHNTGFYISIPCLTELSDEFVNLLIDSMFSDQFWHDIQI